MHAKVAVHSLLLIHSGLQFGGELKKPLRQEQDGSSLTTLHSALGPQGDGWHGLTFIGASTEMIIFINMISRCEIFNLTYKCTSYKWITSLSIWTATYWIMIDNLTSSTNTTSSRTWVDTFLIDTCLIKRTFRT